MKWRREVIAFADAMERKLRANDWKPGWKDDSPSILMDRMYEEMAEFKDVLDNFLRVGKNYKKNLLNEAADVANMLMMVVDVCGALAENEQEAEK